VVGLSPTIYIDEALVPSPSANRANAERPIRDALDAGMDLLLCEDDIDLATDFVPALEAARETGWPVTFWLEKQWTHPEHYWPLIAPKGGVPTVGPVGIHKVRRFKESWYGSQCVLLPFPVLERLAQASTFGVATGDPIDRWLKAHLPSMLVALPNPVQHRSPPTVVPDTRHARISPTFHLAREGRWMDAWQSWITPASPKRTR